MKILGNFLWDIQNNMLILKGNPRSTNNIYKSHCKFQFPTVYMSKAGKDLKLDYQWQLKSQWKKGILNSPLKLKISLWFGDKRKRDIDNYNKILFDSMSGIIYKDDEQIQHLEIIKGVDKDNPRIEINIEEL